MSENYNLYSSAAREEGFFGQRLKVQHLRILAALARLKLVTKVADALAITQPAVSKQLAEMEHSLGIAIIVRERNRLFLTPAGKRLAQHAQAVLDQLKRAELELDAVRFGVSGDLRIGTVASLAAVMLPQAIATLKQNAPDVSVSVTEGHFRELLPKLLNGAIDIAIARTWHEQEIAGVAQRPLASEPLCVVADPGHPLARRDHLEWDEVTQWPWILPDQDSIARQELDAFFTRNGTRSPRNVITSLSLQLNLALLREMPVITLFPRSMTRPHIARGEMVELPIRVDALLFETRCFWRIGQDKSNATLNLLLRNLDELGANGG
ncbi:LysR family transcriptional regulator [Nitratireductor sp. StC3]|uniref:LysR family transcriptional regulator n=1 Tax=Nitratireductor sp. StC3 TaxID=2126741 RepID=UPI000D0DD6C9|nr:LysR family transcriptional regulator [Nitratireductor sp. StC3]PSM18990.1 transcriptional regulator [Nitratireductor sp. StC3]